MLTCDRVGDVILKARQFTAVVLFQENGNWSDGNWKLEAEVSKHINASQTVQHYANKHRV